jgi:hypothetical protein
MIEAAFPFTSLTANGFECRVASGEPTHFSPIFFSKEAAEKWAEGRYRVTRLLRTNPVPRG